MTIFPKTLWTPSLSRLSNASSTIKLPIMARSAPTADLLGERDQASLLRQTLEEEKETDQKLTELSKQINMEATKAGVETTGTRKPRRAA